MAIKRVKVSVQGPVWVNLKSIRGRSSVDEVRQKKDPRLYSSLVRECPKMANTWRQKAD